MSNFRGHRVLFFFRELIPRCQFQAVENGWPPLTGTWDICRHGACQPTTGTTSLRSMRRPTVREDGRGGTEKTYRRLARTVVAERCKMGRYILWYARAVTS